MNKRKIINDPVYGFTTIPDELIYDLIQHPYFQRLRRIRQLGLTDYVYPGAVHTRFHHALGALHLMTLAIDCLRSKGIEITVAEAQAAQIAILLHDIGHSPFSHALERKFINRSHEEISLAFMHRLNTTFHGQLDEAIQIFSNQHAKTFLSQLVSGQLDVDRMDYLNRDSFFTGVAEGVIGYERIIKMLHVVNNQLVVEAKGLYTVEKFLHSRRIMYWQVYLHKTVLAAEKMLVYWFEYILEETSGANAFTQKIKKLQSEKNNTEKMLSRFATIDDTDVMMALKSYRPIKNHSSSILAEGLVQRKLFKCLLSNKAFDISFIKKIKKESKYPSLVFSGKESNAGYTPKLNEIMILMKDKSIVPLSKVSEVHYKSNIESKFYLIYS
ncbi:MAG: HD domain-containing protein [Saprospiraceae bacterium]